MKKENLTYGNVVELRNGDLCILERDGVFMELKTCFNFADLSDYCSDLTSNHSTDCDIMKIYKDFTLNELLWKRKEVSRPSLSEREKEVLNAYKTLGCKYIAEDKSNRVACYTEKPRKSKDKFWISIYGEEVKVFEKGFSFLSFEDEEPWSIEELLKGE